LNPAIGIDVGGTKIAAGLVDTATGACRERVVVPTGAGRDPMAILADCVALAARLAAGRDELAIGIGVCELVDPAGRLRSAHTIDWRDVDVEGAFAGIGPATVESDVRAGALAEARFGAGRPYGDLLYVSVGTGISTCLVLGGRPYPGARGHAICFGAPPVEDTAGGRALALAGGHASAQDVFADPALDGLVESAAADLGGALAALVNALDPAALVVGGGLGMVDRYRELACAAMRPLVFADDTRTLPVLAAQLGADAGLIGAALAARA
jgi:glucokinase